MIAEHDLIPRFCALFDIERSPRGPGDDCAVLPRSKGPLSVTTDAVIEGVHFTRPAFRPPDIGHKALAVNLSDLAAMGARPDWFVCAIAMPKDLPARELLAIGRGMSALARAHRVRLVGGNFSRAGELSITITAAGVVGRAGPLLRSGARPGDRLYVSGTLGDARAGLSSSRHASRQRRPIPRVGLGSLAARFARAGMDVSDGFAQDLGTLATASGVGVEVSVARLPVGPLAKATARTSSEAIDWALTGGEDYELLLAVPERRAAAFERACGAARERVSHVGTFVRSRGVRLLDPLGVRTGTPLGFDHFRR